MDVTERGHSRRRVGPGATRRGILRGPGGALAAGAVVACGAPGAGSESAAAPAIGGREATLRLWHWDTFWESYKRHADLFTEQYPRLKVEVEPTTKGEYVNKLVAQVAGGNAPDTIGVSVTGDFNVVQAKGMVMPLDAWLKRDRFNLGDFFEVNLRQHQWAGKRIGLPSGWTMTLWYFNLAHFAQVGGKTPLEHWRAGTWTWDTYLDLAQRFRRLGDDVFGSISLPVSNNSMSFPLIWSNGGDVFDAQYTRSLLDQAPAMETYDFMYRVHQSAPPADQASTANADSGKLAMWFDWEVRHVLNLDKWSFPHGIVPPPAAPKTKRTVFISNAPGFSVATGSRYPEEAWALLAHMVSPEGMKRYFQEANVSPVRRSQSTSREFWKSHPRMPDPGLMAELVEARNKSARSLPRISNFLDLQTILREEFNAAWAGTQSVRDAALKSTQRATGLLAEAEIDR
jgi:multiple sugar transport system substrate-binding protein